MKFGKPLLGLTLGGLLYGALNIKTEGSDSKSGLVPHVADANGSPSFIKVPNAVNDLPQELLEVLLQDCAGDGGINAIINNTQRVLLANSGRDGSLLDKANATVAQVARNIGLVVGESIAIPEIGVVVCDTLPIAGVNEKFDGRAWQIYNGNALVDKNADKNGLLAHELVHPFQIGNGPIWLVEALANRMAKGIDGFDSSRMPGGNRYLIADAWLKYLELKGALPSLAKMIYTKEGMSNLADLLLEQGIPDDVAALLLEDSSQTEVPVAIEGLRGRTLSFLNRNTSLRHSPEFKHFLDEGVFKFVPHDVPNSNRIDVEWVE